MNALLFNAKLMISPNKVEPWKQSYFSYSTRQSLTVRFFPSLLLMKNTGALHGDVECQMSPFPINWPCCCFNSCCSSTDIWITGSDERTAARSVLNLELKRRFGGMVSSSSWCNTSNHFYLMLEYIFDQLTLFAHSRVVVGSIFSLYSPYHVQFSVSFT